MNRAGKRGRKGGSETERDEGRMYPRKREGARARTCTCAYVYAAEGDSPHCDCYTHGRNVPPVCRLMPTRNQTRADSSYCSLSSQQRSNRLHNLPPALLFAARHTCRTHTHAAHGRTLCTNSQLKERKHERKKEREREERVSLTTCSTVYEKCSTRIAREKKEPRDSLRFKKGLSAFGNE